MVRRPPAFPLLVALLFCFVCSAWAQSAGQEAAAPGIWNGGRWIGYTPAHVKYASRNRAMQVARSQTAPTAAPCDGIAVNGQQGAPSAGQNGQSPETGPAEPSPSPVEGEVVPASFQQVMPAGGGAVAVDPGCQPCGCIDAGCAPVCTPEMCCEIPCCPSPWVWAQGEYLLWWTSGMNLPPLVTTSPQGTLREEAGVLGQPNTTILFGDAPLEVGSQSGARVSLGMWLDPTGCRAIEGSYMILGQASQRFEMSSEGDPTIARPFFSLGLVAPPEPAEQSSLLIAFDGVDGQGEDFLRGGSILVEGKTRFQGAELLFRRSLVQHGERQLHLLLGYQFNRLEDELLIEHEYTVELPALEAGTHYEQFDLFDTANSFHGAQLGVVFRERLRRLSLDMSMKLGLGGTHSRVLIDGETISTLNAVSDESLGGLLALASNIGEYQRNHFAMIPELGVTLGYDVTCGVRATFGYTFLYWSKVARPGDQIDLDVNISQFGDDGANLVGEPRPEFSWVTTDFWAQGLRFGLDCRY